MRVPYSEEFGRLVRERLAGRSARWLAAATGLSPAYASHIVNQGRIPADRDKVIAIADALELDQDRLLVAAGYEARTGAQVLLEGLVHLGQELGRPLAINFNEEMVRDLTPDKARAVLDDLRQQVAEGLI